MNRAVVGRFVLRDLAPWEGAALFAMTGDNEVMRYMGFPVHHTVVEATQLIATYAKSKSKYQAICLDEQSADVIGIVGFEVDRHHVAITIMFRRDWKARGAGREFSKLFVQWLFTHESVWRVSAYCHVDNVPVQNLLRRMNAKCEGLMRRFETFPNVGNDEPQDCYLYSIVRD